MKYNRIHPLVPAALMMVGISLFSFEFTLASTLYRCEPIYPTFCKNIHVGCAGRTRLKSISFSIKSDQRTATIIFDNGHLYRADILSSGEEQLFQIQGTREWIRLEKNGRYSRRIYYNANPLMALGQCTTK